MNNRTPATVVETSFTLLERLRRIWNAPSIVSRLSRALEEASIKIDELEGDLADAKRDLDDKADESYVDRAIENLDLPEDLNERTISSLEDDLRELKEEFERHSEDEDIHVKDVEDLAQQDEVDKLADRLDDLVGTVSALAEHAGAILPAPVELRVKDALTQARETIGSDAAAAGLTGEQMSGPLATRLEADALLSDADLAAFRALPYAERLRLVKDVTK